MTFFSLLYEKKEEKYGDHQWVKFKKSSLRTREKSYAYRGNKLVRVQDQEEPILYPSFYEDLHLDYLMERIYGKATFNKLQEVFVHLLGKSQGISYRQQIVKDLEGDRCYQAFVNMKNQFLEIKRIQGYSQEVKERVQSDSYALKAVTLYCKALERLKEFYREEEVASRGLRRLKELLMNYMESESFRTLKEQSESLQSQFEQITYQLFIEEKQVIVSFSEGKQNYIQSLAQLLGETDEEDYFTNLQVGVELNGLESKVLALLSRQYSELFKQCHKFVEASRHFIPDFIGVLEEELEFYIGFIDYMKVLQKKGFHFCYPKISKLGKMEIQGLYDLALADKKESAKEIITNDLQIEEQEKGAYITGANQGGKTTFIRGLGQSIYLMALGLPIAGSHAKLPAYERIYTHFQAAEDEHTQNGKLKEELIKLEETLESVNAKSLVLINELFSSTTMKDGHELAKRLINQLTEVGARVLCVTHIVTLPREERGLVSLVAQVNEEERSYKIIRKPVDDRAYTQSLIRKYHLSYEEIKERINYGN